MPSFGPVARLYDQVYFFRARAHWGDSVFAKHRVCGRNEYGLMYCWSRNNFFSDPAQPRSTLYQQTSRGCQKNKECPRELCVPALFVFAYFFYHVLRNSGWGRRLRDIFWTVTTSDMMVVSIEAVLDASYCGVRVYFRVPDPSLLPPADDLPGGGLVRLFCLPPKLLGSKTRRGIEEAVRGSSFWLSNAEGVFRRMGYIFWAETSHPCHFQYS